MRECKNLLNKMYIYDYPTNIPDGMSKIQKQEIKHRLYKFIDKLKVFIDNNQDK